MEAVFICHKSNNWHEMRIAGRTKAEAVMLLLAFADGVIACVRQYQYRGIGAAFYLLLTGLLLAVVLGRDFGNFRRFRQTKPYDVQFYQDHFDVITPETQEARRRPYSMLHKIVVCPNTVCLYVIGGERYICAEVDYSHSRKGTGEEVVSIVKDGERIFVHFPQGWSEKDFPRGDFHGTAWYSEESKILLSFAPDDK